MRLPQEAPPGPPGGVFRRAPGPRRRFNGASAPPAYHPESRMKTPGPTRRLLYRVLAVAAVGAGSLGLLLPVLPTTPFLLVALWASARGAPEWYSRIRHHPRFAPTLAHWENERAVSLRAKITACAFMAGSWLIMLAGDVHRYVLAGVAVLFTLVAGYLVTRPAPSGSASPEPGDAGEHDRQ
jgi:hypothetical protein